MADFNLGRIKFKWRGAWNNGLSYIKDDIVLYGGQSYVVKENHLATTVENDLSLGRLELMAGGTDWKSTWQPNLEYKRGDIIKYKSNVYIVIEGHTAGASFEQSTTNFANLYISGLEFDGEYDNAEEYNIGNLVTYGNSLYLNIQHTQGSNPPGGTASTTTYAVTVAPDPDDGNNVYYLDATEYPSLTFIEGNTYIFNMDDTTVAGHPLYFSTTLDGKHAGGTVYEEGVVYYLDGQQVADYADYAAQFANATTREVRITISQSAPDTLYYVCEFHSGMAEDSVITVTESSEFWTLVSPGISFRGDYNDNTQYFLQDVVRFGGYTYIAKGATNGNQPTNTNFWEILNTGLVERGTWDNVTSYSPGDVVVYGPQRYVVKQNQKPPVATPPTNTTYYDNLVANVGFKGTWTQGTTYYPGDVVREGGSIWICEFTHEALPNNNPTDNDQGLTWTEYVPGMNWQGIWDNATEYFTGDVVERAGSSFIAVAETTNNDPSTDDGTYWNLVAQGSNDTVTTTAGDMIVRGAVSNERLAIGPAGSYLYSDGNNVLWGSQAPQQSYYVSPTGDDANDGRTAATAWRTVRHACDETYNVGQCSLSIFAGVYEEQCPIRVGRSVVIEGNGLGAVTLSPNNDRDEGFGVGISDDGSTPNANSFVFQVNNGARIRNVVFRNFSTNSVMVSLDPGTSPDDTSVWITSQSPYVQNCTNFSPGGTGMWVDGALHNGGYKSMVANDWTQINSDGIGIRASTDARIELVSVFTYYCNPGYFAESGGKIRSVNGSSAYGELGVVADGFSQSETPLTGSIRLASETINSITELQSEVTLNGMVKDEVGDVFAVGFTEPDYAGTGYATVNTTNSFPYLARFTGGELDWQKIIGIPTQTNPGFTGEFFDVIQNDAFYYAVGRIWQNSQWKGYAVKFTRLGEVQWQKIVSATESLVSITTDGDTIFAVGDHSTRGASVIGITLGGIIDWSSSIDYSAGSLNSVSPVSIDFGRESLTSTVDYTTEGNVDLEGKIFVHLNDATNNQTMIAVYTVDGVFETSFDFGDVIVNEMRFDNTGEDGLYFAVVGETDRVVTTYAYPDTTITENSGSIVPIDFIDAGAGAAGSDRFSFDTGGTNIDQSADVTAGYVITGNTSGAVGTVVANPGISGAAYQIDINVTSGAFQVGESVQMQSQPTVNTYRNPIVARFDIQGNVAWQKTLEDTREGRFLGIAPLGDEIFIVGSIESTAGSGLYRGLVASFDSQGNESWTYELKDDDSGLSLNQIEIDGVNLLAVGQANGVNAIFTNLTRLGTGFGNIIDDSGTIYDWVENTAPYGEITQFDAGTHTMEVSGLALTLTDANGQEDTSPDVGVAIKATRAGFSGIGAGISFNVNGLERPVKPGSVAQIDGDGEYYFVIGTTNYDPPTITSGNNTAAVALLNANRQFLIDETVGYVNTTYPAFVYNEATCARDVGLMVDAFVYDLDYNTNGESVDAGWAYYDSASGRVAITEQKTETVAAITHLKALLANVLDQTTPAQVYSVTPQVIDGGLNATGSTSAAQTLADVILDIINIGKLAAPEKIGYGTINVALDPSVPSNKTPEEGARVVFREAFSQVRMTGHDFLDIGTGGFADTNYPVIIADDYTQKPEQVKETVSQNGGRVFYVTTDQDGNFRVGDYFKVEQATGRATLSSEEFDLTGLNELQLGSIQAGKSGAVVNEFSTDPALTDISDQAVSTEGAVYKFVKSGFMGTDAMIPPRGSTDQRPGELIEGQFRYNTTLKTIEFYNGTEWTVSGGAGLSVTSILPSVFDPNVNTFIEVLGDKFTQPTTVIIGGITVPANQVSYISEQELRIETGIGIFSGLATDRYDITLTASNGSDVTIPRAIEINRSPTWNTGAGSLGNFPEGSTINVSLSSTEPDAENVTYSIQSDTNSFFTENGGPIGLNTTTGVISGTLPTFSGADRVYNFTIRVSSPTITGGTLFEDRTFSVTVLQNDSPTITSPGASTTPGGDDGTTVDSTYGSTSISVTASDPDGDGLTYSVTNDPTSLFNNGLNLNSSSGLISGTITHSWLNRAYDRTGSVTIRVTDDAASPETDEVTFNIKGRTTWRYRTVINRGYMAGGYRSSVPWQNVNRTNHSTDTSTNLGNLMDQPGTYMDGGFSDVTGWTWGNDPSYPTNSNRGWAFNMNNDTRKGYNTAALNMSAGRNDHGVSNYDTQFSVITGGGSANTDIMQHSNETMRTNVNNSGIASDYLGAAWSDVAGYHWNGTHRRISFSSESWSGLFSTQGTHSKGLTSKYGFYYIGPPNNSRNLEKVNSSNDTSQGTIGNYPNNQTQGEHNFQMGQDAGYSIGMWQSPGGQVNDSWKLTYSNDSYSFGNNGAGSLVPKGQPGCSSGGMFSTGI